MAVSQQIQYLIYTEDQMTGFIHDGIMHKTIIEIIHGQNVSALRDLIIYTDNNDPDILVDSLYGLTASDMVWFITNQEVIKTMFPETYTNILSNILNDWLEFQEFADTTDFQLVITGLLGLFNTKSNDYNQVLGAWLTYENMIELFDFLSELNPKIIIQSGVCRDLFYLLEQILLTKIKLADGDITKIPCFDKTDVQTYMDLLGNYIIPQLGKCDPMIIRAYDAMRQYLVACVNLYKLDYDFQIYILFANKFHPEDRETFRQICQIISQYPLLRLTTEYGGIGIFLECCQFDLPDELISLLNKYDISPYTLLNITDFKILAKIFYSASYPKFQQRIHDVLWSNEYFGVYIEWFNNANFEDLLDIETNEWPLNIVLDNSLTPCPNLSLINLKAYDSPTLLLLFLRLNDLTDEILEEQTVKIGRILIDTNLTTRLFDTDDTFVKQIKNYLQITNGLFNPKLVRNKLVKLRVLKNHGFISLDVYKCLEQEVFAKYIHSFGKNQELPLNESRYELQSLLDEYKPDYTHNYWEALIKSELKVNSDYTKQVIGILKRHYLYLAHQIAPEPQMLLGMLNSKSIYPPKCEPDLLIAKFAVILSEFYTEADLDHNDILNQLIQMRMSIGIYHVPNTNYIDIITINIYTNYTNYRFQLNKTVIEKIINQLSDFIQRPLTIDNYSDILVVLSIILEKYCDRVSGKQIMLGYLTELFTSNDNMLTSDTLEMCIINTNLSTEYISSALDGTEYTINIGKNETTGQICLKIRPVNILIETIQKTRWRNWCAKRHIPFSTQNLELLADPDTNEFICPITLEPQKKGDIIINLVGCRHKFSAAGIIEWSRTKDTCPVCRAKLADGKLYGANCEMLELIK